MHKPEDECIIMDVSTRYGFVRVDGRTRVAHRHAYEQAYGPIPPGLVIDHLCRNTRCINHLHLEAVTQRENLLRGGTFQARSAAKTECLRGHEFTPSNTYVTSKGQRHCRACSRLRKKARRAGVRSAADA